jgi:hypothetical protein
VENINLEGKVMNNTSRMNHYKSDTHYQQLYGKGAIVTRLGWISIVHLDHPNKEKIQKRIEEIMHEEISGEAFFDDCPLCQEFQKQPYDIIYYSD